MKKIKNFIISTIITIITTSIFYFFIKKYDNTGYIIGFIQKNIYYTIFLLISVILYFGIGNTDKSSYKMIKGSIFTVNIIYLGYLFIVGNIGLGKKLGLIFLGLLIIVIIGNYIKNRFGYIITIISAIGCIGIIFISIIPLYGEGPDIQGFQDNFKNKLIIYSDVNLEYDDATITNNRKEYKINKGLNIYDINLGNEESKILFKSNNLYENTFGVILYKNGEFVELNPQSAINITPDHEIKIITGNIKYFPQDYENFKFIGKITPEIENKKFIINIIQEQYQNMIKSYIQKNTSGDIKQNKITLNISKWTLKILSKIFPGKYEKNIKNLNNYIDILDINMQGKEIDKNTIKYNLFFKNTSKNFTKGINATKK